MKSDTEPADRKREEHLSRDGKWRSFPKVPHLLQYASNDNYYGRIKVGGKIIRETLDTNVWTTAKLRLTDFLKKHQEIRQRIAPPKFSEAAEAFKRELENDLGIKPRSREYRLLCLLKIEKSWPGLWELQLDEITPQSVRKGTNRSEAPLCRRKSGGWTGKKSCKSEEQAKNHKKGPRCSWARNQMGNPG